MTLRVTDNAENPWFVAKDVCDALGITNSRDAMIALDADERNTVAIPDSKRGNPNKTLVTEFGLYALVMKSRKPEAKAFRKWVTSVVLPAIHSKTTKLNHPNREVFAS